MNLVERNHSFRVGRVGERLALCNLGLGLDIRNLTDYKAACHDELVVQFCFIHLVCKKEIAVTCASERSLPVCCYIYYGDVTMSKLVSLINRKDSCSFRFLLSKELQQ